MSTLNFHGIRSAQGHNSYLFLPFFTRLTCKPLLPTSLISTEER
uniref:Uncharacterized protein n=1 Tax=Anguilla anguilla TaxID=7936 RepID=A0A0E9W1G6_ANGAN